MPKMHESDTERSRYMKLRRLNETFLELASIDEQKMQNMDGMLQNIVSRSKEVLRADLIEFYEYYQSQNRFRLPQFKAGEYLVESVRKDDIYEDDVMYYLIRRRQPFYSETTDQVPAPFNKQYFVSREGIPKERFYTREKIKSLAVIPIRTGDENVGLMFANYRRTSKFDDELKELINLFATQTAIVIKNARQYQQLYQRRKALIDVSMALNSQIGKADQESIFEAIYNQAKEKLSMKDLSLAIYDETMNKIRFAFAYFNGQLVEIKNTSSLKPRKGLVGKTGWVIENKEPLLINSIEELRDLKFTSHFYDIANRMGYSWLGVPMRLGEKVLGVIATHNYRYNSAFSQNDLDTLQGLADIAAISIHNVDLYSNVNEKAKKLTADIEEEKNLMHTLINNVAACIYAKDKNSRFKIANNSVAKIMGAEDPSELYEKTDFDYYSFEEANQYYQDEQQIIKTGRALENKKEFSKDQGGNPRITLTTKVPWKDIKDHIIGTIGIGVDITELHEAQSRLQAVIDQLPDHVYLKDKKSRFVLVNATVLKEFRVSSVDEVIGKTDFEFHPSNLAQEYFEYEQKILNSELEPVKNKSEKIVDPKTGKIKRLLTTKMPFKNDQGEIVGIIGINRDITEAYRNYSIRRISEAAYNAENLNEFYKGIYSILNEILPAENLYITVYNAEKQTMNFLFFSGNEEELIEDEFDVEKGLAGYVFRTQKPLIASNDELTKLEKTGVVKRIGKQSNYWMGVPLTASKDIGVITVQTYDEDIFYDEKDFDLLKFISNPIAQAIERILRKEERDREHKERKKRLDALFAISEAARSTSSLERLYEKVHEILQKLMYAENIYIALYKDNGQGLDLPYFKDEHDDILPGDLILTRGLSGYVLKTGEALLATDEKIEKYVSEGKIDIIGTRPIDWIGAPLKVKGKTIGIIAIQTYLNTRRYKEDDKNIMSFVSEQIAVAIEQVRSKELQIKAVEKISSSIVAPIDLDEVLIGILETAQEMINETAICDILIWDKRDERLKLKWVQGKDAEKNFQVKLGEGITGYVAKYRIPYLTGNTLEDPHFIILNDNIKSELAVPIFNEAENELFGVLNFEHVAYNTFDEDDKNMAMALGNLAAIAIANKNLIKERDSLKDFAKKLSEIF